MPYDDSTFGRPIRQWIPAQGIGHSIASAGTVAICSRFYPRGPVVVKKFGILCTTALTGSCVTVTLAKGASASTVATLKCGSTMAAYTIGSVPSLEQLVGQGSYLTITADGTADTGSICCFMDLIPQFDGNWLDQEKA